ncbi:MAG: SDR family NAD(P)-dependent oxidoreductase [Acidimicrobiales bacterium]
MVKLDGRGALITGGASGLGAEIARVFTAAGAHVAIVDRDERAIAEIQAELPDIGSYAVDVTDEPALVAAIDDAASRMGGLHVAVCSAIAMSPGPLLDLSTDDWKRLVDVGLHSTFVTGREVARHMVAQDSGGSIINLSSNAGLAPYPGAGAYSSTKAAVIMLSKQQGIEWAPHGIRSNAICPGHVETPLTAYLQDPEIRAGREAVTPLGRVGQPADVASAALYLASDDSSWVTSTALVIDGGIVASIYNHMPGRKWRNDDQ